jgi:hypothetical protein
MLSVAIARRLIKFCRYAVLVVGALLLIQGVAGEMG